MSFDKFELDGRCINILDSQKITEPTPVQAESIPVALTGRDVVSIAQTGTGKTLAFGLPSLTRLAQGQPGRNRMLVLAPTRELAHQVHEVLRTFGRKLNLRTACIYGGVGMGPQENALRRGCDIIVATPGRLMDHMERGNLHFKNLEILVLDEADRMLDMGFLPDIKRILKSMPRERQTLMFSATFPKEIERLTADFQNNPERIEIALRATPTKLVRQTVYTVTPSDKQDLLASLLRGDKVESAIVFMRTKYRTDRVATQMKKQGFKVQAIHGGRSQRQRQQAIEGFRSRKYNVLIATDVAARGLDIQGVTHVFNFDVPQTADDYVHRIGRTARANMKGDAITFVSADEGDALQMIQQAIEMELPQADWEGAIQVTMPRRGHGGGGNRANGKKKPYRSNRGPNRGHANGRPNGKGRKHQGRATNAKRSGDKRPAAV